LKGDILMTGKKTQRAKAKKPKFQGNPYKDYTVGITQAARAVIEAEIAANELVPHSLHGKEREVADLVTAAELIIEIATAHYRQNGMPQWVAGYFEMTISSARLQIHFNQRNRLLSCWVASEADHGKVLAVHVDHRHCSADFLVKHRPDEQTIH
jgi:hypothetical protein